VPFKEFFKCIFTGGKQGGTRNKQKSNLSFFSLLTLPQINDEIIEDLATITHLKGNSAKVIR